MTDEPPAVLDRIDELAEDFKALSHANRLKLLHLLTRPRYGEELSDALEMTRQNALKHVERLEDRGFVKSMHGRRETGPVIEYQVVPQHLYALSVALQRLGRLEPEGGPEASGSPATLDDEVPGPDPDQAPEVQGARLLILDGPDEGSVLELAGEDARCRIGRDDDRDLVLGHDPYVSNHHAEIHVAPAGHSLVDIHSSNGTFVNYDRLPEGGRVKLSAGDVIRVGHTRLVYQRA